MRVDGISTGNPATESGYAIRLRKWHNRGVAPIWEPSAAKHKIPQADAIHAMLHPTYVAHFGDEAVEEGQITLFIGHPHGQTKREIEVLVHEFPETGKTARIFHVMDLGPKFRRYREENP